MQLTNSVRTFVIKSKAWLNRLSGLQRVFEAILILLLYVNIQPIASFYVYVKVIQHVLMGTLFLDMLDMLTLRLMGKKDLEQASRVVKDYRKEVCYLVFFQVIAYYMLYPVNTRIPLIIIFLLLEDMTLLIVNTALGLIIITLTVECTCMTGENLDALSVVVHKRNQSIILIAWASLKCGGIRNYVSCNYAKH